MKWCWFHIEISVFDDHSAGFGSNAENLQFIEIHRRAADCCVVIHSPLRRLYFSFLLFLPFLIQLILCHVSWVCVCVCVRVCVMSRRLCSKVPFVWVVFGPPGQPGAAFVSCVIWFMSNDSAAAMHSIRRVSCLKPLRLCNSRSLNNSDKNPSNSPAINQSTVKIGHHLQLTRNPLVKHEKSHSNRLANDKQTNAIEPLHRLTVSKENNR